VVAKVRKRIVVNKQGSHKFYMERFNLKMLYEIEDNEKYSVEVSRRFCNINNINVKCPAKESLGYYELKKHSRRFTVALLMHVTYGR
jgi:hypothetical protein